VDDAVAVPRVAPEPSVVTAEGQSGPGVANAGTRNDASRRVEPDDGRRLSGDADQTFAVDDRRCQTRYQPHRAQPPAPIDPGDRAADEVDMP